MYHDAYTLQKVEPEHLSSFNFAAGMVPFLLNLIQDVSSQNDGVFCDIVKRYVCTYVSAILSDRVLTVSSTRKVQLQLMCLQLRSCKSNYSVQ